MGHLVNKYNLIGFANKYYTLWEVKTYEQDISDTPNKARWTHYKYVKNISFDKKTAFEKYPGVSYDDTLRGQTSSYKTDKVIIYPNVDTFRFGKYIYKKIEEVADLNYTKWYYKTIYDKGGEHRDGHLEFVEEFLKKNNIKVIHRKVILPGANYEWIDFEGSTTN